MKGNKIESIKTYVKHHQGKTVFIEFNFNDVTMCGSEEDWEETVDRLSEEYPDGIFSIYGDGFNSINNEDFGVHMYHNLIGNVYEWIE